MKALIRRARLAIARRHLRRFKAAMDRLGLPYTYSRWIDALNLRPSIGIIKKEFNLTPEEKAQRIDMVQDLETRLILLGSEKGTLELRLMACRAELASLHGDIHVQMKREEQRLEDLKAQGEKARQYEALRATWPVCGECGERKRPPPEDDEDEPPPEVQS